MRNNNPMQFLQQVFASGKSPQQLMKELQFQNPSQFNSAMKQIEEMQKQGLTPQQALVKILGHNNPIFQFIKNFVQN